MKLVNKSFIPTMGFHILVSNVSFPDQTFGRTDHLTTTIDRLKSTAYISVSKCAVTGMFTQVFVTPKTGSIALSTHTTRNRVDKA